MGVPQQQVEDLINYMRQHNLDTKELAQILSKPSLTWPDGLKWVWDLIAIILGDVFASDPELIESKIKTAISFYDARNLFLQKVIGGDSSQCNKPRGSDHVVRKMKSVARWHQCKGTQLEKERCGLAKERLLTWWADMEWTQELHKKGRNFQLNNPVFEVLCWIKFFAEKFRSREVGRIYIRVIELLIHRATNRRKSI